MKITQKVMDGAYVKKDVVWRFNLPCTLEAYIYDPNTEELNVESFVSPEELEEVHIYKELDKHLLVSLGAKERRFWIDKRKFFECEIEKVSPCCSIS